MPPIGILRLMALLAFLSQVLLIAGAVVPVSQVQASTSVFVSHVSSTIMTTVIEYTDAGTTVLTTLSISANTPQSSAPTTASSATVSTGGATISSPTTFGSTLTTAILSRTTVSPTLVTTATGVPANVTVVTKLNPNNTPVILGATVGGIVAMIVVICLLICCLRSRQEPDPAPLKDHELRAQAMRRQIARTPPRKNGRFSSWFHRESVPSEHELDISYPYNPSPFNNFQHPPVIRAPAPPPVTRPTRPTRPSSLTESTLRALNSSGIPLIFTRSGNEKIPSNFESSEKYENPTGTTSRRPPVASSIYSESPVQALQRKPTLGSRLDMEIAATMDSYRTSLKPAVTVSSASSMAQDITKKTSSGTSQHDEGFPSFELPPVKPFREDEDEPDKIRQAYERKKALARLDGRESRVASMFGLRKINL